MEKQILSKTVFLNYVNSQKATSFVECSFPVRKIVVKPIASYQSEANAWLAMYSMTSNLVGGESLGICGGSYSHVNVAADINSVNIPYQATQPVIFKFSQPKQISGTYTFILGDIANMGLAGTNIPVAASFALTLEFHE